jgi:site-specific recombinase XerD
MKNVLAIKHTNNSLDSVKTEGKRVDHEFSYLKEDKRVYTLNLVKDWKAQVRHIEGLKNNTIDTHFKNMERLLRISHVAPWELKPKHVVDFFESKVNKETGETISPATHAQYCSSFRSFQNFMMDLERSNEIFLAFGQRPVQFVNEENNIAVKRHKNDKSPKGWALTPEQIDAIDQAFSRQILEAYKKRSKSFLPLQRDRVMFHLAIHFALRVSELITLQAGNFYQHHDPKMAHFGKYGLLTVTGKNSVTGSVPMREPEIYELLKWYMKNVRQKILMRRKDSGDGTCKFREQIYLVSNLLFPSERGGVVCDNAFRKRLNQIALDAGVTMKKLTPHILRHTGCTLMVPVYSPEIAQKYMRHKNLYTTLGYYHPTPLDAASEANIPYNLFDDEKE